ncbi:MAG: hypothetical protein IPI91_14750 [Flavobacteriales bacterium]|nr:hypothetical protein [Flavobacteriales bacterium]
MDVRLDRISDALVVPAEALIPDIQGQKVLVIKNGKAASLRVKTGIRSANTVQLTSGAQVGDSVMVTGILAVREGMPVSAISSTSMNATVVTDSAK